MSYAQKRNKMYAIVAAVGITSILLLTTASKDVFAPSHPPIPDYYPYDMQHLQILKIDGDAISIIERTTQPVYSEIVILSEGAYPIYVERGYSDQSQGNTREVFPRDGMIQTFFFIQGGFISVGESSFLIDSGQARVFFDRIFLTASVDGIKSGKLLLYGKLNEEDGLKGMLIVWKARNTVEVWRITAKGTMQDIFPA